VQKSAYLAAGILALFLTACEEKSSEQNTLPIENTTEIFTPKDKQRHQEKRLQEEEKQKKHREESLERFSQTAKEDKHTDTKQDAKEIGFQDLQGRHHTLHIHGKEIYLDDQHAKSLMFTLFSTWCPPCKGQLPYLDDIHSKHAENLTVLGFVVNDDIGEERLRTFLANHHVRFPVSRNKEAAEGIIEALGMSENYPLPLTALYHNGNYIIHYEGAVPPEMIEHDIATRKEH
jgi:thiol-disulfide isomerase/thioredoxin